MITDRQGIAVVDSSPPDTGPAELRDEAGVPGCAARRRRHGDAPLEHARIRPSLRGGADRFGRHRPRSRPHHVPDVRARPAGAQLLARARRDRCRRAGGGSAHRPQLCALDPASARGARGGRSGSRRGRSLCAGPGSRRHRPSCVGSPWSSTTWWRASTGSSPCRRISSRTPRTSSARRSPRSGYGSRTSSGTSATMAARALRPPRRRSGDSPGLSTSCLPWLAPTRVRPRRDRRPRRSGGSPDRCVGADGGEARLQLEAAGPVKARVGRDRVAQVIDNLVSNALRHAPQSSVDHRFRDTGGRRAR